MYAGYPWDKECESRRQRRKAALDPGKGIGNLVLYDSSLAGLMPSRIREIKEEERNSTKRPVIWAEKNVTSLRVLLAHTFTPDPLVTPVVHILGADNLPAILGEISGNEFPRIKADWLDHFADIRAFLPPRRREPYISETVKCGGALISKYLPVDIREEY